MNLAKYSWLTLQLMACLCILFIIAVHGAAMAKDLKPVTFQKTVPAVSSQKKIPARVTALKPDLVIDLLSFSPENPNVTDEIAITFRMKNQGKGKSKACKVSLKVGGEASEPIYDVPALSPGQTYAIRRHITLARAAVYGCTAKIDAENQNAEINENNNEKSLKIRVQPKPLPDLMITRLTHSPVSPDVGDEIAITIAVKNRGPGDSKVATLKVQVGQEETPWRYDIPALAPGGDFTLRRHLTLPDPAVYICAAMIDEGNHNSETNENNNEKQVKIRVRPEPLPDMIIDSMTHSPANPGVGDEVAITFRIKNQGPGDSISSKLKVWVSQEENPSEYDIPALTPGGDYAIRLHFVLTDSALYNCTAIIDHDNQNAEILENNNELSISFNVRE